MQGTIIYKILDNALADGVKWHLPVSSLTCLVPENVYTGHQYSGMNVILLYLQSFAHGYSDFRFCTKKQAEKMNCEVLGNAKPLTILFPYKSYKYNKYNGDQINRRNDIFYYQGRYCTRQCLTVFKECIVYNIKDTTITFPYMNLNNVIGKHDIKCTCKSVDDDTKFCNDLLEMIINVLSGSNLERLMEFLHMVKVNAGDLHKVFADCGNKLHHCLMAK